MLVTAREAAEVLDVKVHSVYMMASRGRLPRHAPTHTRKQYDLDELEKGDPPRRITVAELVGFSEVFGVPVESLLLPPEVAPSKELSELFLAWDAAREAAQRADGDEAAAWERLQAFIEGHPETAEAVERFVGIWTEFYVEESQRESVFLRTMHRLTSDEKWVERWHAHFEEAAN